MNLVIGSFSSLFALVCALVSSVLSVLQVRDHLRHNPVASLRIYVNRVLLMVPVYAWTSYASLSTGGPIYWDMSRDLYEAFVIYSFLQFLIACLGGEDHIRTSLSLKPQRKHMFPFNCLRQWSMGDEFFEKVKWGTLQYVAVKPAAALLALICGVFGVYNDGELSPTAGYFWVTGINNFSQIWAMYCLILFYLVHKDDLKSIRPVPKFLCIKGLIFFTFWQSVSVQMLVKAGLLKGTSEQALQLDDLIICIEMVAFAIAHRYAFAPADFWSGAISGSVTQPMFRTLLTAADVTDVFSEIRQGMPFRREMEPESTDLTANTARVFVARDPSRTYHAPAAPPTESPSRSNSATSFNDTDTDTDTDNEHDRDPHQAQQQRRAPIL